MHGPSVDVWSAPRNGFDMLSASPDVWFRSDMGLVLDGEDPTWTVTDWADQSGNGNDASQLTATEQLLYVASDANFNGHPSLYNEMATSPVREMDLSYDPGSAKAATVWVVVRMENLAGGGSQLAWNANGSDLTIFGPDGAGTATDKTGYYDGGWRGDDAALEATQQIMWLLDTNDATIRRNGSEIFTLGTYTLRYLLNGVIISGAQKAWYAEWATWSRILSADEIDEVESYAAVRYGL